MFAVLHELHTSELIIAPGLENVLVEDPGKSSA